MNIELLFVDGRKSECVIQRRGALGTIYKLIGCDCSDAVNLRDGRVMIVDDTGLIDGKPVNAQATAIYHGIYPLAKKANQPICGDVCIATDEDFA